MEKKMYCVYLTTYSGDKLPKYYVGSSSLSKIKNGYKGSVSSKEWKLLWDYEIEFHPELFDVVIISEHRTRLEALQAELQYQLNYNVVESKNYINKSLAQPNGFFGMDVSGENNPMYGKSRIGEKHNGGHNISQSLKRFYSTPKGLKLKQKQSNMMLGKNNPMWQKQHSDDFKRKQSMRMTGKNNPMFGKTHSEENKKKQSERMKGENNPSCKLRKKYEVNGDIIDNAKLFCEEKGLAYTNFITYADTNKQYKGYIIKRIVK
jgi:hypothetical protein